MEQRSVLLASAFKVEYVKGRDGDIPKGTEVRRDDSPQTKLEPRELEVFMLTAQGKTNLEIAEAMSLSPKTISTTSQNIKDKLGMHRAADITLLAVRHKLVEP